MPQEAAGAAPLREDVRALLATAHDEGRLFPHGALVVEHAGLTSKQALVYVAAVERLTLPEAFAGRTRGRLPFGAPYAWDGRNDLLGDVVASVGSGTVRRTEFLARALSELPELYPPAARPASLVAVFRDHDGVERRFRVFEPSAA